MKKDAYKDLNEDFVTKKTKWMACFTKKYSSLVITIFHIFFFVKM